MQTQTILTKLCYSALLLVLVFNSCDDQADTRYPKAESQNFNVEQLSRAIDSLAVVPGFKSIVLGRGGEIAVEEYFNETQADELHDVRSVTKSVMALLIGTAIEDGYIQNEDEAIREYLPTHVWLNHTKSTSEITIKHLLTMSCGLEWHELDGGDSYSKWYRSGDHANWVLDQDSIHASGQGFNYNTGSTYLLSLLLTEATGLSALEFAQDYLFEPIGIYESDWKYLPSGSQINNGGAGLMISPQAMFALGKLMLNGGRFGQEQIVPGAWVDNCIAVQNQTNGEIAYGSNYGYLWWNGQGLSESHYFAMGWGGQFIVCVPDKDLVVTATCEWQGYSRTQTDQNWYDIFIIIIEDIIPAVE